MCVEEPRKEEKADQVWLPCHLSIRLRRSLANVGDLESFHLLDHLKVYITPRSEHQVAHNPSWLSEMRRSAGMGKNVRKSTRSSSAAAAPPPAKASVCRRGKEYTQKHAILLGRTRQRTGVQGRERIQAKVCGPPRPHPRRHPPMHRCAWEGKVHTQKHTILLRHTRVATRQCPERICISLPP